MVETPQPDNPNGDRPVPVSNVSGGVSVDGATVTIGGDVVGRDKITQTTNNFSIFRTVRQVIAFLLIVVAVGALIAFGVWSSRQPAWMDGDFNIAVADFVPSGDADKVAPIVGQRIFSFLNGQYMLSSFQKVQVIHDKIGVITGAGEAQALAKKIKAHLVIYGDVTVINGQALVTPQFYVADTHQTDVGEANGEHQLSAPIRLPVSDLAEPSSEALKVMEQNTSILTEFTKALVYLTARTPADLRLARESIDKAIAEGKRYDDFPGKEVLYLFASDIARRQGQLDAAQTYLDEALRLNQDYGRGYIAQANIYYDQGNLYQAVQADLKAKQLPGQPLGAYIVEKASLGIGHSCWNQFQSARQHGETDQASLYALATCALDNYRQVIDSYVQQAEPEMNLREMAAWAYFGAGTIYQAQGQADTARTMLEQARNITTEPELLQRIEASLKSLEVKR
jgi:tetratricopeptide (TPR) repeat protein